MAKIACQTITWGEISSADAFWKMLSEIKSCGYDGVEPSLAFLEAEDRARLEDMGLSMVATHTGGDFRGRDMDTEARNFYRTAEKVRKLGGEFVFISGAFYPNKTLEDWKQDCEAYNRLGAAVKDAGLKLCYHNHHFEFKKKRMGINTLKAYTDPELVYWVPDIGWVTRGDEEPADFLREFGDRVQALHYKEFTFDDHFTELGKGIVDFKGAYEVTRHRDLWIVAEQDIARGAPVDSARENAQYLRNLTGD